MTSLKELLDGFERNVEANIPTELRYYRNHVYLSCCRGENGYVGIAKIERKEAKTE